MLALLLLALSAAPQPTRLEEFCPAEWEVLPQEGCVLVAPALDPSKVLIYFHGMLPPDLKEPRELLLLGRAARARGFTVLALRGESGLCPWGNANQWWCWPSDKSQVTQVARQRSRVEQALGNLERRFDTRLEQPFVAGFSNGGYFTTLLISDSDFTARAWAVLHGGTVTGQSFEGRKVTPTLLVAARGDAIQLPGMKTLQESLTAAGWVPSFVLRDGQHEVREDDVSALFDFFARVPRKSAAPRSN